MDHNGRRRIRPERFPPAGTGADVPGPSGYNKMIPPAGASCMRSLSSFVLLLVVAPAPAADDAARALQRKVKAAIAAARPAIAGILVSRSADYHKARYWGTPAPADSPGRLGSFDADAARKKVPEDARNRKRILAAIRNHDLSDAATVPESYGSGIVIDKTGLVL